MNFPFPSSFLVGNAQVQGNWPAGVGPTQADTGSCVYPCAQLRVAGTWYDCDQFDPDGSPGQGWFSYNFPTPGFPDAIRVVSPAGALSAIPIEAGESALVPPGMNPGDVMAVSVHDNGDDTVSVTFDAPFTTAGGMSLLGVFATAEGQGNLYWTPLTFPAGSGQTTYTCVLNDGFISPVGGWLIGDTFAINPGEQTIRGPQRGLAT